MVNYPKNWHKITLNNIAKYHKIGIKDPTKHNCKTSQNGNQESNLTRKWKYHKIVIENQI